MFRRPGRGRLLLVAFIALSIGVITLDFQTEGEGPLDKARDAAGAIVAPIQRGVSIVARPVRNFFASLGDLGSLRTENEELRDEVEEYKVIAERAEEVEAAFQELTDEVEIRPPWFTMDSVVVEVIADQPANYKWAVTISKGSDDGIEPNMAVVDNSAGGLVGKTVEPITADSATVLLLIDPTAAARARIGRIHDAGLVTGNGAGEELSMDLVEDASRAEEGDPVATATYDGGIFPPNIPIGEVSSVTESETSLTPSIEVSPVVDFDDLQSLQVLLETGPFEDRGDADKGKPAR